MKAKRARALYSHIDQYLYVSCLWKLRVGRSDLGREALCSLDNLLKPRVILNDKFRWELLGAST